MTRSPRRFVIIGIVMLMLGVMQIRHFESVSSVHILAFFAATLAGGIFIGRGITLRRMGGDSK